VYEYTSILYTVLYLLYSIYKYTYIIVYINYNLYLFFGFLLLTSVTSISKAFCSSVCFSVYLFPCYIPKTPRLNLFFSIITTSKYILWPNYIYLVCSSQTLYLMNRNHCQLTIIVIAQKMNNNNNKTYCNTFYYAVILSGVRFERCVILKDLFLQC